MFVSKSLHVKENENPTECHKIKLFNIDVGIFHKICYNLVYNTSDQQLDTIFPNVG